MDPVELQAMLSMLDSAKGKLAELVNLAVKSDINKAMELQASLLGELVSIEMTLKSM